MYDNAINRMYMYVMYAHMKCLFWQIMWM